MVTAYVLSLFISLQPASAVCDQLTDADVIPLIGPIKSKQPLLGADTCVWAGDQRTLSITRMPNIDPASGAALLEAVKQRVQPGDAAVDEPGIGQRAVSESIGRGHHVAIIGMAGTTSWNITVEHVYNGLKPDELLPKLRVVAKKLVR